MPVDINIASALLQLQRLHLDAAGFSVQGSQVVKAPAEYVEDPTGGAVVDTEGRAAFRAFRDLLVAHGLMHASGETPSADPSADASADASESPSYDGEEVLYNGLTVLYNGEVVVLE
jgi:hypothetical protein